MDKWASSVVGSTAGLVVENTGVVAVANTAAAEEAAASREQVLEPSIDREAERW